MESPQTQTETAENEAEQTGAPEASAEANEPTDAPQASASAPDDADTPEAAAPHPAAARVLLGFLAVSPTAGDRSGQFPGRMIGYPIRPGFDEKASMTDLREQLEKDGNWSGYSVLLTPTGVELVPVLA